MYFFMIFILLYLIQVALYLQFKEKKVFALQLFTQPFLFARYNLRGLERKK